MSDFAAKRETALRADLLIVIMIGFPFGQLIVCSGIDYTTPKNFLQGIFLQCGFSAICC